MNKENLIWKYFLEQKVYEVSLIILWIIIGSTLLYGFPMAIGLGMGDGWSRLCENFDYVPYRMSSDNVIEYKCPLLASWFEGFMWLIVFTFIGLMLFLWFNSNWKKATEKAEEEFKKRKITIEHLKKEGRNSSQA